MDLTTYLTLRSSNLATLKTANHSVSTLTGSTLIVTTNITAPAVTASTITVSTINGLLPGTGSGTGSSSTMISIGASTTQSNNFSGGSFTTGWGSTLTGLTAITDVAVSQSGQYQLAVQNGSSTIRTSANSGITWGTLTGANGLPAGATAYPPATAAGVPAYTSISASATGQYQLASVRGGLLYVCANGTSATPTFTAVGMGTPNIYLPMEGSLAEVINNSSITPTGSVSYVTGIVGTHALKLTNTASGTATQYVRGTWNYLNNFTVACWVNFQSITSAYQVVYSSHNAIIEIFINPSNQLVAQLPTGSGTTYSNINTSFPIVSNTWYHLAMIFQMNGLCSFYVNHSLIGTFTNSGGYGTTTSSGLFCLGTYDSGTSYAFNGYIDDFKIYNSVVTYSPIVPMNWSQTAVSASGQYMLAACASGGVFQSSNYGVTWTQVTASVLNPGQAPYTIGGPTIRPNSASATTATWTANNVTWTVSASTVYQAGFEAYRIFNTSNSSWASATIYNASGVYIGAVSTTILGGVGPIAGEWIQIQSSAPIVMNSYNFTGAAATQWPKTYYIVGSNDSINWYPIHSVSLPSTPAGATDFATPTSTIIVNQSGSQTVSTSGGSAVATCTTYPFSANSYTYFRMVGSTLCGSGANFCLGEWYIDFARPLPLYVTPSSTTVAPQLTGLAANTWTASGVSWTVSASTTLAGGYFPYYMFDSTYSNRWVPSSNTYSTAGNSSGIYTTIQGISSVQGDWLQLQSSVPLVMTSYQFANGSITQSTSRIPKTFYIIGSTDGATWYPIQYGSALAAPSTSSQVLINSVIIVNNQSSQTFGSSTLTTTTYPTTTNAYTYFRLVALSTYTASGDNMDIGEWLINFSAPAPSNTSFLAIIPQQSGLAAASWTTANGVSWVASSSSIYNSLYYAYYAFNNILTGTTFASNETYTSGGATQAGSPSTAVSGLSAQVGEWLQLQSSVPLVMNSYIFSCGGAINLFPKTYIIVGSNDGTTWYPIQSVSFSGNPYSTILTSWQQSIIVNLSGPQTVTAQNTVTATTTTYSSTTNAYTYFRIIATSTNGTLFELAESYINFTAAAPNSVNALAISSTNMMVSAASMVSPNRTGLASSGNAVTTSPWTINGVTWIAKASSVFDPAGTTGITNAFNNLASAGEWVPSFAYYTAAGNASGQITMIQGIGNVTGEWLQIQSSVPLVMASYRFATGNGTARLPKTYYIVGSNDGTTNWYPIQYVAGGAVTTTAGFTDVPGLILVNSGSTQTFGSSTIATTIYSTTTNAYTYFRLICLSSYSGTNDVISLGEWYINFQTGSIQSSVNNGSNWTSALTLNTPVLATAGSYVITSYKQIAYLYSNGISGTYTTPTLTGINADIDDASISASGQYMTIVTLGTTNNVFYSTDYGITWSALTVGSSALTSCAMSADGSYFTVANATTVYTLNRNTQGFSVAIGNQAGTVNQAQNAIAIGNKAGLINQSANSIVLNATGNAFDAPFSGFFAAPIANYTSSYASSFNLLGYGSDSQIVQSSAMTVLQNGYIGIGTTVPGTILDVRTTNLNLTTGVNQNQRVSMIINQGAAGSFNGTFGGYMESGVNYGVSHYLALGTVAWSGTASTFDERIRILGTGNVGVGTTTPAYPLHVVGNINLTGSILYNGVAITTGTSTIWNAGSGGVAYYSGGNVGIGTASPSYTQTISASPFVLLELQRTGAGTNYGSGIVHSLVSSGFRGEYVRTGGASNGTTATTSQTQANGVYFIDLANAGVFKSDTNALYSAFYMTNTNALFNGPNVGIGTTSPTTTLDVVGTIQGQTAFQSSPNVNNVGMGPMQACYLGQYGAAASRATSVRIGDIVGAAYYMCTGSYNLSFYKDVSGGNAVPALQIIGVNATNATPNVYVQNSLGIGTTPNGVNSLTVYGNGAFIQGTSVGTTTANNVGNFGLRISQVASASNTVGQIVGQMCFHGYGRPYASSFIRSITEASNGYDDASALVFGVSNGGNGAAEAVRISEAGYVGIGTPTPITPLHVATFLNQMSQTGAASRVEWYCTGYNAYTFTANSSSNCSIRTAASIVIESGFYTAWSDVRIKTNIKKIESALDKINQIDVVSYDMIDVIDGQNVDAGVIAQNVISVLPKAVKTSNGYIPNIYARGPHVFLSNGNVRIDVPCTQKDITDGVKVKITIIKHVINDQYQNGKEETYETKILSHTDDYLEITPWAEYSNTHIVFVYGTYIADLLTVDKDQISMLAVRGIQELSTLHTQLSSSTYKCMQELATLQVANTTTSSQMAALQEENAQLKSQVASLQAANAATSNHMHALLAWAQTQGF